MLKGKYLEVRKQVLIFVEIIYLEDMRTANYTDFRANLKDYIDSVIEDCDTVIINRGNDTGVVLISLEEYNSLKETEYIMSSPETLEAIRKGDDDIKNGRGTKIDIDELWK
jgi:antitoxin YefM